MSDPDDEGGGARLKTSRLSRLAEVGSLSGKVGSSYLWTAMKRPFQSEERQAEASLDTHLQNVMRIVESSKELRGAFMKLTQMLSMRDDLFPTEAIDILSVVQSGVPPMDPALIRERIEEELGQPAEQAFASFDEKAFAAASLGQVHRARTHDGRDVVVKVQYPGVEKTVESDLKNVRSLIKTLRLVARDLMGNADMDYESVYDELRERLSEELDYRHEAANAELFRELFADDDDVVIPAVIPELSTERLITLDYIDAYPIRDVLAPGVEQELKDWVMKKLFDVTWKQLLHWGVVHVDPHPGNYLVTYHPKLVLLDFGSVRVLSNEIREGYRALNRALLEDDLEAVHRAAIALEFLGPDENPAPMHEILRKLFAPVLRDEPVDPHSYDSLETATKAIQAGIQAGYWKAPPHRVFLDRVLVGMDGYLKLSGTVANWHQIYKKWVYSEPRDVSALLQAKESQLAERSPRIDDTKVDEA